MRVSTNERLVEATPDQVWEVLSDGWLYPLWVVGATRMREVDATWPQVGSVLHHSVGAWPLVLDDTTSVTGCEPGRRLDLRARAWPSGEAAVSIELEAVGARSRVRIKEDAVAGPGRLVPAPLRHLPLAWRNVETLRRLAYLAERRA
jgi:uncharacterized protein YndB with AHSA1/START domain